MTDLEFLAYNIVQQIADEYHRNIPSDKWLAVRQSTNDKLESWVLFMLKRGQAIALEEFATTKDYGMENWRVHRNAKLKAAELRGD